MAETLVEQSLRRQRSVWARVGAKAARQSKPKSSRILLFGLGSSSHCAHLTAETLGTTREAAACSPLDIGRMIIPRKGDLALAFTHRAKTPATLAALELCAKAGAATALICAEGAAAPKTAQTILSSGPLKRCEPHTTGVTGALCAATSWLLGTELAAQWEKLTQKPDPKLEKGSDGPKIILGFGAGEWVAREAALKFIEMSGQHVEAFNSEEFFHGWAHAHGAKAGIWHVAAPNDPRATQIKSSRRFSLGAGPLGWVESLVELQWLALARALTLGRNPDGPKASTAFKI